MGEISFDGSLFSPNHTAFGILWTCFLKFWRFKLFSGLLSRLTYHRIYNFEDALVLLRQEDFNLFGGYLAVARLDVYT